MAARKAPGFAIMKISSIEEMMLKPRFGLGRPVKIQEPNLLLDNTHQLFPIGQRVGPRSDLEATTNPEASQRGYDRRGLANRMNFYSQYLYHVSLQ